MKRIEAALDDIGTLDRLARQQTPVHRLDPRAKVLVTLAFLVTVVSYGKYEISALAPLAFYPVALLAAGGLPWRTVGRYLLLACPFAILIGIFNPLLDREILLHWGPLAVSGGWVSFASILCRFILTVSAAIILIACTGINNICLALERLGLPRLLANQLQFSYRYLFILAREGGRLALAHALRAGGQKPALGVWGSLAGQLLLRAYDRAQRIHQAMQCRGFDGEIRFMRALKFSLTDGLFVAGWSVFFILVRSGDWSRRLGELLLGI